MIQKESKMLRVESKSTLEGFTEFEDDILFDEDDPDFDVAAPLSSTLPLLFRVRRKMSMTSVHHPAELHSSHSSLPTLSHSVDDVPKTCWSPHADQVLTIEELRLQMTSCFSCGVSWIDSHVSLDCTECGGYALERPCPVCNGQCGSKWKRDLSMSHASSDARWEGKCTQNFQIPFLNDNSNLNRVSHELSSKLEKLSTKS